MKRELILTSFLAVAAISWAETTVSVADWSQNAATSQVTLHYTLTGDASAVVTLDVCTNGVSIGADNISRVVGDVNKIVAPSAETRTIKWRPDLSWEGHLFTNGEITVKAVAWPLNDPPPYMAVNLACTNGEGVASMVRYYASAGAVPGGVSNDVWRAEGLLLRRIPAAGREFVMGSPTSEPFHVSTLDEKTYDPWVTASDGSRNPEKSMRALPETCHVVSLTKDFYMGVFPITCAQYDYICNTWNGYGVNASEGTAYKRWKAPMMDISWNVVRGADTWPGSTPAATAALGKLRTLTGLDFDLPTEAQWEFACRAGTTTGLNSGKEVSTSQYVQSASTAPTAREVMWAWCYTAAEKQAASMIGNSIWGIPVGLLKPNAWGLYDMHGNVGEWCLDWVDGEPLSDAVDPSGLASSSLGTKALRGGSAGNWPFQCRSGTRAGLYPDYANYASGFRVICPALAVK